LVVVIAILEVLAAVAIPRVNEFLRQATEQSYIADLAIIQSAVSAWYSDLHNDPFLGSRQYPIIGRNETSQDGRITRGKQASRVLTRWVPSIIRMMAPRWPGLEPSGR
jgi:type II secretory pathway pseudopilin PulG